MQQIISMAQTNEFVQKVIHSKNEPTAVVLFLKWQILDIKRFCVTGKRVLCVDKMYNLGKTYATVTVFQNLAVFHHSNHENPLFLGPIFLHGKSDHSTFLEFFNCINFSINTSNYGDLIIETDDEKAIHLAISKAFDYRIHILCTRHLKQNLLQDLSNEVGAASAIKL